MGSYSAEAFIGIGVTLIIYGFSGVFAYGRLTERVEGQEKAMKDIKISADTRLAELSQIIREHVSTTAAENMQMQKTLSRIEECLKHLPCDEHRQKIEEMSKSLSWVEGNINRNGGNREPG